MLVIKKILDALSGFLMILGGIAMVVMMVNVAADIIARNFLHVPIPGTLEFVSGYYMVATVFLPLAYVQRHREHVMIELFTLKVPPRVNAFMDGVIYVLCAIGLLFFTYATIGKAIHMTEIGEMQFGVIDVITWPSRWFVPLGCGVMALYMLLQMVAEFIFALKGEKTAAFRDVGHLEDLEKI
jgi:TRAP-type C4-dicarboxylate transport system permease small subunit